MAISSFSYAALLLFTGVSTGSTSPRSIRKHNRAISALHSTSTSLAALYLLNVNAWPVATAQFSSTFDPDHPDDRANPIISGKSSQGNRVTGWETGYLIYDTLALLYESSKIHPKQNPLVTLSKNDPVFLTHHVVLILALSYLQTYIAKGREKGVWVIVAFLLMNASNPLLHLRWWSRRRHNGQVSLGLDVAFAAVFAASRFGLIVWILKRYGDYHGFGPFEALRRQRISCKSGTAVLVGVNAVWWASLVRGILLTQTSRYRSFKKT